MELIKGLLMCILVITIIKFIRFRYLGKNQNNPQDFSWKFWVKDNWMDYIINLGLSLIVYTYDHDAITTINTVFKKLSLDWEIPHFENSGFYFVLVPFLVALLTYKYLRKKVSVPVQKTVNPNTFSKNGTINPDPDIKPPKEKPE